MRAGCILFEVDLPLIWHYVLSMAHRETDTLDSGGYT